MELEDGGDKSSGQNGLPYARLAWAPACMRLYRLAAEWQDSQVCESGCCDAAKKDPIKEDVIDNFLPIPLLNA